MYKLMVIYLQRLLESSNQYRSHKCQCKSGVNGSA